MNGTYYTSSTNLLPPKTNNLYTQIKYVFNNYSVFNNALVLHEET